MVAEGLVNLGSWRVFMQAFGSKPVNLWLRSIFSYYFAEFKLEKKKKP